MSQSRNNLNAIAIRITGTVQGVGFRPFVYRCASVIGIVGEIKNDSEGVFILAGGVESQLELFVQRIKAEAPPLSHIRSFTVQNKDLPEKLPERFLIVESISGSLLSVDIPRDTSVCEHCLAEMRDPNNRRYHHPFINCTDCGPRYTLIGALPYDRLHTTMVEFALCSDCLAEYQNPMSRRFHAQPICCPQCGPALELRDSSGNKIAARDPLMECIRMLMAGNVVAIKGIGGFHLACRADSDKTVALLRKRKSREEKPFALMARDCETALTFAQISAVEERLLTSVERPIVLLQKRADSASLLSDLVAPGFPNLGIMLPYAPVHHLIFEMSDFEALIMTSANLRDEPMVHETRIALEKLGTVADAFLVNNRRILSRTDDSIARIAAGVPLLLRRGRGFVPEPLPAPCNVTGIVGCGGVLKSTVSVGRGRDCFISQYVGNIENVETLEQLNDIKNHLLGVLQIDPSCFAVDLHPQALSTHIAGKNVPFERIQHHHAHAAACMAENNIKSKCICIVYDGTGFGDDGTIWGGELFIADYYGYERAGHLLPMLLPGGDAAILNPWRMAMGALFPHLGEKVMELFPRIPVSERRAVFELLQSGAACLLTSGMGRLFDCLSALIGISTFRSYEGQPAIMLEAAADQSSSSAYDLSIEENRSGAFVINGPKILMQALSDFTHGAQAAIVAGRFHHTIARTTAKAAMLISQKYKLQDVCLTGGCFQNALLLELTVQELKASGLNSITHRLIPPNDESISYGQVVIAGMRRSRLREA